MRERWGGEPPIANGFGTPPPPPVVAGKTLRQRKAATKLKRSSQMGSLYRALKGKVEGVSLPGKGANAKRGGSGKSNGGGMGMADALAEITKRSAYFQQIEEDVRNYEKAIIQLQPLISVTNLRTWKSFLRCTDKWRAFLKSSLMRRMFLPGSKASP